MHTILNISASIAYSATFMTQEPLDLDLPDVYSEEDKLQIRWDITDALRNSMTNCRTSKEHLNAIVRPTEVALISYKPSLSLNEAGIFSKKNLDTINAFLKSFEKEWKNIQEKEKELS